jgi:hypothetical protein
MFSQRTIHIIGDSHAIYCFTNEGRQQDIEQSFFNYQYGNVIYEIPFVTRFLSGRTMHRVGRDGLIGFNITNYGVCEGDIVAFLFGEVDVRNHIGYQRDIRGRNLEEIIETLASKYVNTIILNKNLFYDLTVILISVLPPGPNKSDFPMYGTIGDRICITKKLNQKIKFLAEKNDFLFFDIYSLCCDQEGGLKMSLSGDGVHINMSANNFIKEALMNLIFHDHKNTFIFMIPYYNDL